MADLLNSFSTVTEGRQTVTSTTETPEQISEVLKPPSPEGEPEKSEEERASEAASELGKRGGEAAAKARAKREKEAVKAEKALTTEEAPAEEDDDEAEIAAAEKLEKEGKLGKPRSDPRARMLQKAREAKELRTQLAAERTEKERISREAAQLRAARNAPAPQPAPRSAPVDDEPKQEDFDDFVQYTKAVAAHTADKRWKEHEARQARQNAAAEEQYFISSTVDTFKKALSEAEKADPEIRKRVAQVAAELQPSFMRALGERVTAEHVIADRILLSKEMGPALLLHFADHPEDRQRIASLETPSDVIEAMAELRGKLSAATTASAPRAVVSRAKPPVRPVTGSPHVVGDSDEPDEDAPISSFVRRDSQLQHSR